MVAETDGGRQRVMLGLNHTGRVSGAERVVLRVLARAAERGWSIAMAAPDGPLQQATSEVGGRWVPVPDLTLPLGSRPLAFARLATRNIEAAWRLRRATKADVVVATGMRVLPVLTVARLPSNVVWLAQSVVDRPRWRALVRCCGGAVDLAVAVSGAVGDSLVGYRFPVEVVWNGTEWPVERAPRTPPDPPVVGCLAVLTPWKGQDVLLEAVAQLPRKDVIVELAGQTLPNDAAYEQALRRRAAQPDLAGRVRFLGHVDNALEVLRRWSVDVVASVEPEAGPLAALEAMSVGIPIIATAHGGPQEIIGDAGILVPPGSPDAMAAAIETVLSDPQRWQDFGDAGRRIVASNHRLDRQIDAVVDLIESVALARRR